MKNSIVYTLMGVACCCVSLAQAQNPGWTAPPSKAGISANTSTGGQSELASAPTAQSNAASTVTHHNGNPVAGTAAAKAAQAIVSRSVHMGRVD